MLTRPSKGCWKAVIRRMISKR